MSVLSSQLLQEHDLATTPTPPKLRPHHGEMKWSTRWFGDTRKENGRLHRFEKRFGTPSEMTKRQAMAVFNIWLSRWHKEEKVKNPKSLEFTYSAEDLAIDYTKHCIPIYQKHGRKTSTTWEVRYAMQALIDGFGKRPANDATSPQLAALRDSMIRGVNEGGEEYLRTVRTVNGRLAIIKQAYRWARERGLVSRITMLDLCEVSPLREGKCDAKKTAAIMPADEHWIAVTKAQAPSPIRAMIDLQWLTGMRPGEACVMRAIDIDMTGEIWMYKPAEWKTEHLDAADNRRRIIPLGVRSQKIIGPFLARATDAYFFSPKEAQAERNESRRQNRKPQKYAGWYREPKFGATAKLSDHYTEEGYRRAIHYACAKATKELEKDGGAVVVRWNPNQLRHSAATRLNKIFPIEDVSETMGHADTATTRIYAEQDVGRAIKIARMVG